MKTKTPIMNNGSRFVGNQQIYSQQEEVANNVMTELEKNQKTVVVVSEPQAGKTGAIQSLSEKYLSKYEGNCMVIYVLALSDLELKKQNNERFITAGLTEAGRDMYSTRLNFFNFHHGDLRESSIDYQTVKDRFKKTPNMNVLIIIDESHIAQSQDSMIDALFSYFGIKLGEPKSTWRKKNVDLVMVTATDYAFKVTELLLKESALNSGFSFVKLKYTTDYFSLKDLIKSGRLSHSEDIVTKNKGKVTEWFADRIDEFLNNCKKNNNGYMILRTHDNKSVETIRKYIKNSYRGYIETCVYECLSKTNQLSELPAVFGSKPVIPKIIIIKNALRMGKTLYTTKFIRMWIDTKSASNSNCASVIQSIGRNLGYVTEFDKIHKHTKFMDTYKIYCNMKEIENCNIVYSNSEATIIPSSSQNRTSLMKPSNNNHIITLKSKDRISAISEIRSILDPILPKTDDFIKSGVYSSNIVVTIDALSKNTSEHNNWSHRVINFNSKVRSTDNDKPAFNKKIRIIYIDNIPNKLRFIEVNRPESFKVFQNSRRELLKLIPEANNSYLYMMSDNEYELFKKSKDFRKYKFVHESTYSKITHTLHKKFIGHRALK